VARKYESAFRNSYDGADDKYASSLSFFVSGRFVGSGSGAGQQGGAGFVVSVVAGLLQGLEQLLGVARLHFSSIPRIGLPGPRVMYIRRRISA
jgi:hypothetical protein